MKRVSRRNSRSLRFESHSDESWAVSYVDLLTLLLCFFIIFFSLEKNENRMEKKKYLSMLVDGLQPTKEQQLSPRSNKNEPSNKETARQNNSTEASREVASIKPATSKTFEAVISKVISDQNGKSQTRLEEEHLFIEFEKVSFFGTGQKNLNSDGLETVERVISYLRPFKDKVKITVQGHTDPTGYVIRKDTSNWELSVLRATSVLKLFVKNGFEQKYLSAEGFSSHKSSIDQRIIKSRQYKYLRRVTFKIEELKK